MAARSYDEALRRLLVHEGGYSNHPSDPGGPTNFGITIHDYRKYVKAAATADDVRRMSVEQAKAIYRSKYWNAMRCDELPAGVDYAVFDYGVNSGIGRAPKVLKHVLGLDAGTGAVTADVVAAARRRDTKVLVHAICDERMRFLRSLRTWPVFGNGWGRRVREVRAAALAMAANAATAASAAPAGRTVGRGQVPLNGQAQAGSAGGAAAAGTAAAAQASEPAVIVLILVVTAALAAAAWFFWRWRQRRQQDTPMDVAPVPAIPQGGN